MSALKYSQLLQEHLTLSDHRWEYEIANLPKSAKTNEDGLMKSCTLVSNSNEQKLILSYIRSESNRAISTKPLSSFLHFTCADFRLRLEDGTLASFRESTDYVARLLKNGISLNKTRYSFYGHSNSQLKGRSCILMAGSQENVDKELEALGKFNMKTVAKKAKRIGLLFSTAHAILEVESARCRDIPDIETDSYNFTDGCGKIAPSLAKILSQKMPIVFRNKKHHPVVFQIRYRGYKGVVMKEPRLRGPIWLEFRQSMKKFSGGNDHSFAVVEYSKPFTYGYLNDEVILLLHSLGIERDILIEKQQAHLTLLDDARTDARAAFLLLNSLGEEALAERLLMQGVDSCQTTLQKLVTKEHGKMLNKRQVQKSRIFIQKSRLLFGVCDPRGVLREGECFVKPTSDEDGIARALTESFVLVAKNPCLHPGDLQKLRVVAHSDLGHLEDCIVFPVKGRRPAADMMSGGDLDGDTFFVCWDSDLIPEMIAEAADYIGPKESVQFKQITSIDRIDYFARSASSQLGQVKNLYLGWARAKGPQSSECQELNHLFSQCVDANKIKIPDRLKEVPTPPEGSEFILDVVRHAAAEIIKRSREYRRVESIDTGDELTALLTESTGHTQFELAQLTLQWCALHRVPFEEYWYLFDTTLMSAEEKLWLGAQVPSRKDMLTMIHNDLWHSTILSPYELQFLGLRGAKIAWKLSYNSAEDRLANLLDTFYRIFPVITRKLLVLRIHERLSVAIYFPQIILPEDETPLGHSCRLFAIPHHKDAVTDVKVTVPTKHDSRFYFDRNGFQLYEGKRANTFVFLTRAANDTSKYQNIRGLGNRARARQATIDDGTNEEWRTSIALNKFNRKLQQHIGRLLREGIAAAELYVISNTDQRSSRNLDLWLEQIDTTEVVSRFENAEIESVYRLGLDELDLSGESIVVRSFLQKDKQEYPVDIEAKDVLRALQLAWEIDAQDKVNEIFAIMSTWQDGRFIEILTEFLAVAPTLILHLLGSSQGSTTLVVEGLRNHTHAVIKALILCSVKMGYMVLSYLKEFLVHVADMSIVDFGSLVKLVALTIPSAETAFELLVDYLQSRIERVLPLTPKIASYFTRHLSSIALDHIEAASGPVQDKQAGFYKWKFSESIVREDDRYLLTCDYRIDAAAGMRLAVGDHLRFVCVQCPDSMFSSQVPAFEVLVAKAEIGRVTFNCVRHPPSVYRQCLWRHEHCGSFTTSQTMMDAVTRLFVEKEVGCPLYSHVVENTTVIRTKAEPVTDLSNLNFSQRKAVTESLQIPMTCIWGPPGTGKTHTTVAIINELLLCDDQTRLLVTAPTHAAVDNLLRRFLAGEPSCKPVRVSTDVRKVSSDVRKYTCDAMAGKDLNENPAARRKAQKQVSEARIVFTTCIGAELGLLRGELFDVLIIDEASQQTEAASLVPLVKGCSRLILVGDHNQLRATVQPHAQVLDFDVSLFERLWKGNGGISKVMLDTQYRMHPAICEFLSKEFYEGKLNTGIHCHKITLPESAFAWPDDQRCLFVQCSEMEDLGRRSKTNSGQIRICHNIMAQLRNGTNAESCSVVILTPYTRQRELLIRSTPGELVSSIDGFQGQEADIVIYVSVRCNMHSDIGFLNDTRRLNVALTRARAGVIIIGDENTLTGKNAALDQRGQTHYLTWKRLISSCRKVEVEFKAMG